MVSFWNKLKSPIFFLFLFAFFVRGFVVFIKMDSFDADPDQYSALAENLRVNGVFGEGTMPTAFRPPLYPFFLRCAYIFTPADSLRQDETASSCSLLTKRSAAALLHWILGVLTVLIVYRLALILTFPRPWAVGAAVLTAVDPILLAQSRLVMTETLAAFLGVLLIWLLTIAMRPRKKNIFFFFGIGLIAGLAGLCRPTFLLFGLLTFAGFMNYTRMGKAPLSVGAAFLAGFFAVIFPWGARNQQQVGCLTPATTHGGYTLLLANNPYLYEYNRNFGFAAGPWNPESFHRWWESSLADIAEMSGDIPSPELELYQNDIANDLAHKTMSDDIAGAGAAMLVRFGNLWQFLPYKTLQHESVVHALCRYGIAVFYFFELSLALVGLCHICSPLVNQKRHRLLISPYWSNWSWLMFLLLSVQIPHLLYWTNMRMRAPLMTIVPIFALVGLRFLLAKKEDRPVVNGGPPTGTLPFYPSDLDQ